MTHAAMKDLENKWRAEAADLMRQARDAHYLTTLPDKAEDITRRADELSAALSAMEGEAVAWPNRMVNLPCPDGSTDRIVGFRVPEGDPILGKHGLSEPLAWLRKVTIERPAPPPQQAVTEAELRAVRRARDFAERTAASEAEGDAFTHGWYEGEQYAKEHPTPSPGPQGGGEALVDRIAYALAAHEVWGGQVTPDEALKDEKMRDECYSRAELVAEMIATPPAHQPGEVVTDAMVERMAKWLCRQEIGESATLDVVLWRMTKWERYVGEARAGLTAALAPKEAGHE